LRNWILILGLLSLHGCRVFNSEVTFNKYSHSIFHGVAYNLSIIDDASENPDNPVKGIKHLWVVAGEEEQEHLFFPAFTYFQSYTNPFLFNRSTISYCIKNLPDKPHACIYIFCKALII
jgi:hypothetical protein